MPVKQVFDKKEDAPEWLRESLLEQDGKFAFEAELPHEVKGLKSALEAERKAKADFEKSLKGFEGIDPEEARRLKAEAEKIESEKLKQKGDWETRERQLKDQLAAELAKRDQHFQSELKTREDRIATLQGALEKSLIEAHATAAIAAAKGVPELLLPHVMRQVKIVEENGNFVVHVLDAQGQPRIANVKGDPFTITNLVDEMKNNSIYGRAFEASGAGGSGATKTEGGKTGMRTVRRSDQEAMNANIEAIAKGEITVID